MLPTFQPRKPFHRRRRVRVAPVPPPVKAVRVVGVQLAPGEPTKAVWQFSDPIDDPHDGVAGLVVNGNDGLGWSRAGETSLFVQYAAEVEPGLVWENAPGAGGITGTDGAPLAAGSGTVAG